MYANDMQIRLYITTYASHSELVVCMTSVYLALFAYFAYIVQMLLHKLHTYFFFLIGLMALYMVYFNKM